jgi:hypothetical protein
MADLGNVIYASNSNSGKLLSDVEHPIGFRTSIRLNRTSNSASSSSSMICSSYFRNDDEIKEIMVMFGYVCVV